MKQLSLARLALRLLSVPLIIYAMSAGSKAQQIEPEYLANENFNARFIEANRACGPQAQGTIAAGTTAVVLTGIFKGVRICNMVVTASAIGTFQIRSGTGVACATGLANLSPPFNMAANGNMVLNFNRMFAVGPNTDLCITAVGVAIPYFFTYNYNW